MKRTQTRAAWLLLPIPRSFTRADAVAAPLQGAPDAPLACCVRSVELLAPFCSRTFVPSVAMLQSPLLPPVRVQPDAVLAPTDSFSKSSENSTVPVPVVPPVPAVPVVPPRPPDVPP